MCQFNSAPVFFQNMFLILPVDALQCSFLKVWKSPLCTQVSFQVCLPSLLNISYFLRTELQGLELVGFLLLLLVLSPPCDQCLFFRILFVEHVDFSFPVIYIKISYQKNIFKIQSVFTFVYLEIIGISVFESIEAQTCIISLLFCT